MQVRTLARQIQADLRETLIWFNRRLEQKSRNFRPIRPPPAKPQVIPDDFGLRMLKLDFAQLHALEEYFTLTTFFVPQEAKKMAEKIGAELSDVHEWLRRRDWLERKRTGKSADIYWLEEKKDDTMVEEPEVQIIGTEGKSQKLNSQELEILELKKQLEQERKEHEETKSQLTQANAIISTQSTEIQKLNFCINTLKRKFESTDDSRFSNLEKQMAQMAKDMENLKNQEPVQKKIPCRRRTQKAVEHQQEEITLDD